MFQKTHSFKDVVNIFSGHVCKIEVGVRQAHNVDLVQQTHDMKIL